MRYYDKRDSLAVANHYAMMSCTRWNKSTWQPKTDFGRWWKVNVVDKIYCLSRRYYRSRYRGMVEKEAVSGADSYPWPYSDPGFADWDESDDSDDYSLISDPSGCVVKYATSYCAWKIYELTDIWPQKKTAIRMDAKNWVQFLAEAGYDHIVPKPSPGGFYVGVDMHEGEWGLVVWYEGSNSNGDIQVSTYRNKKFSYETVKWEDVVKYIWVLIG